MSIETENITQSRTYQNLLQELEKIAMQWGTKADYEASKIQKIRHQLFELNHQHYYQKIPRYRKFCELSHISEKTDFQNIVSQLMLTDEVFKSYPQRLIDSKDFLGLTKWIQEVSTFKLEENASLQNEMNQSIDSIDQWLDLLEKHQMHLVFSSGTSGQMSFVPRDQKTWSAFIDTPFLYLPQILGQRGVLPAWKKWAVQILTKRMKPQKFLSLIKKVGMRDIDGFFMNFTGGNQGIQLVGKEAGRLTRKAHYLYKIKMSATAVRSLIRGAKTEEENQAIQLFLENTIHKKDKNYDRMIAEIQKSATNGRKVMLFGTPYLLKELCEKVWEKKGRLALPKGSHVMYGGGWKSFDGKRISENELLEMIEKTFSLSKEHILEAYSMTEINGLLPKCKAGRFHIPPYLEAVTFDEELNPQTGNQSVGTLGILDPLATSYVGFLITGDQVSLSHENCICGLQGSSILQVERAAGREVKGCGGIMATVNA